MARGGGLKTPMMRLLEMERGRTIDLILVETYNRTGTVPAAAKELGISPAIYRRWLKAFGIRLEVSRVAALQA